jgi:hypothetical protein
MRESRAPSMSDAQRWVIDAVEEGTASIELPAGQMIQLPASLLPTGAKAGQILRVTIAVDAAATKDALAESAAQTRKGREASRKRDPGGDIAL